VIDRIVSADRGDAGGFLLTAGGDAFPRSASP